MGGSRIEVGSERGREVGQRRELLKCDQTPRDKWKTFGNHWFGAINLKREAFS